MKNPSGTAVFFLHAYILSALCDEIVFISLRECDSEHLLFCTSPICRLISDINQNPPPVAVRQLPLVKFPVFFPAAANVCSADAVTQIDFLYIVVRRQLMKLFHRNNFPV